jgi:N-acetyl-1-D-myo-inositol-2-amino-2-deoxy-alpha-D-glucopyranoside deacetylase/mycothiol S-conjugate amidase
MEKRRLLISFAHPDDESFGLGAAIGKWVNEGVEVYLICATNGDVGTIPDNMKDTYDTVAELRLSELHCANDVLRFKEMFLLGYRDSGMMGSETSQHPQSLWSQWANHPEAVTQDVTRVIRQVRPHVVITFNKYGGYGHPDHIAIQQATVEAFERASDATYHVDGLAPYQPQKLYYSAFPKITTQMRVWEARLKGQDPRRMGRNHDIDIVKILDNVEPVHTRIPIADYMDVWEAASLCHESQGGGRITRTAKWMQRLLYNKQGFTRVYPVPPRDRVDEDDVFEGVTFD